MKGQSENLIQSDEIVEVRCFVKRNEIPSSIFTLSHRCKHDIRSSIHKLFLWFCNVLCVKALLICCFTTVNLVHCLHQLLRYQGRLLCYFNAKVAKHTFHTHKARRCCV